MHPDQELLDQLDKAHRRLKRIEEQFESESDIDKLLKSAMLAVETVHSLVESELHEKAWRYDQLNA